MRPRAKRLGIRLLLVRRREGDPAADAVRRAILVDTERGEMAIRSITDPAKLSIEDLADTPIVEFGAPLSDPIFLVCTNGKRDACCALRGRALVGALAAEHGERVWECTHLGGHRFAGNLVCLPDGIVYGRVTAADGPRLASAYLDGIVDAARMRGRSAWPAAAQVAEQALREREGLTGIDDVNLVSVEAETDRAKVILRTRDGAARPIDLRAEPAEPPRPISCGAQEEESPLHWHLA